MDTNMIFQSLFALLSIVLTAFVIPWLKRVMAAQDRREMLEWVQVAVSAAQQLYPGEMDGQLRKNCALEILESQGFHPNGLDIDSVVEASVHNLHSGQSNSVLPVPDFSAIQL